MARIRTIKPEFWTDDKIISLPYSARLFFIGLWNFADDYGCLQDKPEQLKLLVLPGEDNFDVFQILDLLLASDLIEMFIDEETDSTFLVIKNWSVHQKVDKPAKSRILKPNARKVSIPAWVRRSVAEKYGCIPGKTKQADCYFCGAKGNIYWPTKRNGEASGWVSFTHELSHLVAEANDGVTNDTNIVLACRNCNRSMGVKNAFDWLFEGKYYNNHFSPNVIKFREASRTFESTRDGKEGKGMEGKVKDDSYVPPGTDLALEYKNLVKTKKNVVEFLKNKGPDFVEPYFDLWNIFAAEKGMPVAKTLNEKRVKKFKVRIKEPSFNLIEILRKAGQSEFLLTSGKWFGLDWIIENDTNYLKVLEGNYDKGNELKSSNELSDIEKHKSEAAKAIEKQRAILSSD